MNSLEWRIKKLENQIIGPTNGASHLDKVVEHSSNGQESICDQLKRVAKLYQSYIESEGQRYARFVELYEKHKNLLGELGSNGDEVSEATKTDLLLAYEDDLIKHLEAVKGMAEKADKVLNVEAWPDSSGYRERLEKLETVTKEQHFQTVALDKQTEELIDIYNDIIGSFKSNTVIWNQKLEAHESEERKLDDDED